MIVGAAKVLQLILSVFALDVPLYNSFCDSFTYSDKLRLIEIKIGTAGIVPNTKSSETTAYLIILAMMHDNGKCPVFI